MFKGDTGDLWGFNKFECDKKHFEESEYLQLLNIPSVQSPYFGGGDPNKTEDGRTAGHVSATLDDIGINDLSHIDAATHR